jgi:predicted dehydrogenase
MGRVNRRDFLKATTAAAGVVAAGRSAKAARRGPNDTVRVGVIGVHGQGNAHIGGFTATQGAEVVALCDVDSHVLDQKAGDLEKKTGRKIARYEDLRKMLDDQSIDAVSIATPNHWHTLASIWAMQADKDVYVEKPLSHNVWEGRQLVNAAHKYKKMVQHGTQGRSCAAIEEAMAKLREGVIGDVYMARGLCYKWRDSIGKVDGPQPVPDFIDYDLWLGPAPSKPLMRKRLHYDWHWQWDYGNGDIGNQGVHEMDMCRWGLGVGLPKRVQAGGGQFLFDDDKQVPNVLTVSFDYPDEKKMLVFEVRPWITNYEGDFGKPPGNNVGVLFYGSEGYMVVQYFRYATFLGKQREPGPSGQSGEDRWARFIRAVRSRRQEDLGVGPEEGHRSATLCHLANIAYRTGRTLAFDPATERITDDAEASRLLTRNYRTPFVVPAIS